MQSATAVVLSISRLDPDPSTSNTVRWEITFNRAVAGVRLQNLALVYPSNGQAVPTITDIVPSSLAHNKWTVTANRAGREAGTLQLKWNVSSIETPPVPTAFSGESYNLAPIAPTTFSVRQYGYINIRNVTDDGWYFTGPPALSSVTMYRASEDETTVDQWGSANFGPDRTGSGRNKIARNQLLRIYAGDTPIGTTITVNYLTPQNVAKTISIVLTTGQGQIVSMTRLDPNPTSSNTVRWLLTFDRPVAGVRAANFSFYNFTGAAASITSTMPDAVSGFRKWTITAQVAGDAVGSLEPSWNSNSIYFHPESPYVGNSPQAEHYDFNPLVFSVPPGGSIDIENFYADQLHFRAAPTPGSAQMSRVSADTISVLSWGMAGFMPGSANWLARGEYLRIDAGTTPVGTAILAQAYRTTAPGEPGFEIRVKVEVPDAQVVSCDIIDPSPTVANSVRWDVIFDKAMSGVSAANFGFINSAQIQPLPTITSVAVVPNTGNTKWRVTADTTGTGVGLLGLRYLGHRAETPSAPNTFTGQSYRFSEYPLITVDPSPSSAIIVTGGQAPTLTVAATIRTNDTLYYQWRIGLPSDPYLGVTDPKNISGATGTSFTPPTNLPGHRSYYCRVYTINPNTGQPSGYHANSLPSMMNVYDPPEIVTQPANVAIPAYRTSSLAVGAIGTELQYQWYRGESADRSNPVSGATANPSTTPALTANTRYWVLVFNALGSAYEKESAAMTVRVITQVQLSQNNITPVVDSDVTGMKRRSGLRQSAVRRVDRSLEQSGDCRDKRHRGGG